MLLAFFVEWQIVRVGVWLYGVFMCLFFQLTSFILFGLAVSAQGMTAAHYVNCMFE